MKNTCYVIMPYGGSDEALRKKYKNVYDNIIKPAAQDAGFDEENIFREDHTSDAGTIARNIVEHVSSSSVIIADLTGCNANVYYELGLAHVFHKNATVLICEKGADIRFDLANVKRVEYEASFEGLTESRSLICQEIINRKEGRTAVDNSVHELLPKLPTHLVDSLEERDENELQAMLTEAIRERDNLKAQLQNMGVQISGKTELRSIRSILTRTKQKMKFSGTTLIETLHQYAEEKKWDCFLDYLIEAMEYGTPTLSNINSIVEICSKANNNTMLEDVLCASRVLYPDDSELMTRLAKLYARRPETRMEAMEMVNVAIGLKLNSDGQYELVDRSKIGSHNELARFLDTYLAMENYDGLVNAARFLMQHVHEQEQEMMNRNIFIALTQKGDLDEAEVMLPTIEAMNTDVSEYLLSAYYNRRGDFLKEYEYLERAYIAEPENADYLKMLAVHMLNEDLVRTPEGIKKVRSNESRKAAAAIFYYMFETCSITDEAIQRAINIMQNPRNHLEDYLESVKLFITENLDKLPYERTNRYPLEYILERISIGS